MRVATWKWVFVALAAVLLLGAGVLITGCSDRTNPVTPGFAQLAIPFTQAYGFEASLGNNALRDDPSRNICIYLPPGYGQPGEGRPYPVLYLLHDFGYDHTQFGMHGLYTLANDLLAKGEIKPMLIVTVDASNSFGLGMYANSEVCGNYEDMIVQELIRAIERTYNVHKSGGRLARAIGGLGFGGQAAMKLAIKRPDLFSSVSALNAPLAYAGDGQTTDGLRGLFKYYFIENNVTPGQYNAYAAVRPQPSTPITGMLFAMAAAYSPTQDRRYLRPYTVQYTIPGYNDVVYFELPFDHRMYIEEPVWQRWMQHDVRTLLAASPHALDNIAVYLDAAQQDQYGFQLQTALLAHDLDMAGTVSYEYNTYMGTAGIPADHESLVSTRLAALLKFHSARLAQPAE